MNRKYENKLSMNEWTKIMVDQLMEAVAKGTFGKPAASNIIEKPAVTTAKSNIEVN